MSDNTGIEWADATWNVVIGCDKVSPGCDNCYAIRTATRMQANPNPKISTAYAGTAAGMEWTGQVNLLDDRLALPLTWTRPRKIFVNAQSDLFHDDVPDEFIARVFAVMVAAPQHTFQILTKRHGRMRSLLSRGTLGTEGFPDMVEEAMAEFTHASLDEWPLPNVWLGVSVENQQWADIRIPALLDTPAAIRWISAEPLLGPVHLRAEWTEIELKAFGSNGAELFPRIDWVVVGGESGTKARPMHPQWARSLREQCTEAAVPFLFKQWGEWAPAHWHGEGGATHAFTGGAYYDDQHQVVEHFMKLDHQPTSIERSPQTPGGAQGMIRPGKKAAGRELDGRTWDQYPEVSA